MRKGWRGLIFAVAGLLAAQGAPAQRPHHPQRAAAGHRGPHPALWLLEDSDTKIYLFGTIHILPPHFRWRSPRFDAVARSADELVLEVANGDAPETLATALAELRLGKSVPILWRVPPDRRRALQDLVDDLGIPTARFEAMQTWAVAMGLAAALIVRGVSADHGASAGDGASADHGEGEARGREGAARRPSIADVPGVEGPLEAEFRASHRPVSGVETAAQQMRFFGVLTFAEQRQLLESIVDAYQSGDADSLGGEGDIGQNAWVRGNVAVMAATTHDIPGPLYDVLLRRRNAAWTEWLIHRLDRPGTLLFAVGAAHLAGPDSVRSMLAARGFRVRRIQ
jgi:uncharacterized protein YbaP (TraB family)